MNKAILGLYLCTASVAVGPTCASPLDYKGPGVSGYAVNALITAYKASAFDKRRDPPLVLKSYVVTIDKLSNGLFEVAFSNETTTEEHRTEVDSQSGKAGSPDPQSTAEARDGVAIPGISAGAIVLAYREAFRNSNGYIRVRLSTGAYNVAYYPEAGGTYVAFIPLNEPPPNRSTLPAPTPTPKDGSTCLAGDCDYRILYYVGVKNGQVKIREEALI